MLPTSSFGDYYKFFVTCGNQTAVVFFSDKVNNFISQVTNILFDGTFFNQGRRKQFILLRPVALSKSTVVNIYKGR